MRTSIHLTGALLVGIALGGCSNGSGSTGPDNSNADTSGTTKVISGLARDLIGTWRTDTTINVKASFFSAPVKIGITVSFRTDSSYSATVLGDSLLSLYPLTGNLFLEDGAWKAPDTNTVVAHPRACQASDTATTTLSLFGQSIQMSAPFHQETGKSSYVANGLSSSACPDSISIISRPVGGKVKIDMPVDLPQIGKAIWHLTFVKQP